MGSKKGKVPAEETREGLVAAVIRLLDRRSVSDVSVKDIAAEAGVNHGLVHRYFGTKEALVREAVTRTNRRIRSELPLENAGLWTLGLLRSEPALARILARCCLDGPKDLLKLAAPPPEQVEHFAGRIRSGIEAFGLSGTAIDPHVLNAIAVSALLGWTVFRPMFEAGYLLPPDADEHVTKAVALSDYLTMMGEPGERRQRRGPRGLPPARGARSARRGGPRPPR